MHETARPDCRGHRYCQRPFSAQMSDETANPMSWSGIHCIETRTKFISQNAQASRLAISASTKRQDGKRIHAFLHDRKESTPVNVASDHRLAGDPVLFSGSRPGSMMFDGVGLSRRDNKSTVARVPGTSSCQQNPAFPLFPFFPFPAQQDDTFMTISATKTENAVN